jgi:molecular chaperone DnaK (HSP70)
MIPLYVGIKSEDVFMRVIPRHATISTKHTVKIPAWCAYSERLRMEVSLAERIKVSYNTFLGEVELVNNRRSGQGSVHFELTFEVDTDYMVKVTVRTWRCWQWDESSIQGLSVHKIVVSKEKSTRPSGAACLAGKHGKGHSKYPQLRLVGKKGWCPQG